MKVEYKKDKTLITLNTKEQRKYIFDALKFYEGYHWLGKEDIVDKLLDEWKKEAKTLQKRSQKWR